MTSHYLILHGALGSKEQFTELEARLSDTYQVHSINLLGHGGLSAAESILMPDLVDQIHDYCWENIPQEECLHIFGYSMGGYAALLYASQKRRSIAGIITLGTKLMWSPEIAEREVKMLDTGVMQEKIPAFVEVLKKRHHPENWEKVLVVTAQIMSDLGKNQYLSETVFSTIETNCKLMLGDRDQMVSLDETVQAYKALPHAALSVLHKLHIQLKR